MFLPCLFSNQPFVGSWRRKKKQEQKETQSPITALFCSTLHLLSIYYILGTVKCHGCARRREPSLPPQRGLLVLSVTSKLEKLSSGYTAWGTDISIISLLSPSAHAFLKVYLPQALISSRSFSPALPHFLCYLSKVLSSSKSFFSFHIFKTFLFFSIKNIFPIT